jgi:putative endonuclease
MSSRKKGFLGEDKAVSFLKKRGFKILERNFYAKKFGEIDIIANKNGVLYFIEVKSGKGSFNPALNLTSKKLKKIIDSVNFYLQSKELELPFSISLIVINGDEVTFFDNITI